MRQIVWSDRAAKDFDRLPESAQEAIFVALARFTAYGMGDIKRLQGEYQGLFRLRVGDYRVRFTPQGPTTLLILRVHQRGGAYRA